MSARAESSPARAAAARGAARARRAFVSLWLLLLLLKIGLADTVALFGDEAFYWQESRALAFGYSDVPPLTPWLIRLGTALGGGSELAVRWPFLALGAWLPWLVVAWARRVLAELGGSADATSGIGGAARRGELAALRADRLEADAWWAGTLALCIPIAGLLGVFALPDVPLTVAVLLAALALERALAMRTARAPSRAAARAEWLAWLGFGAALALAWLAHYRAVMLYVAGAAFLLGTASGRATLRRPGFWLAQAVGAIGVAVPFLARRALDALAFQFVERHPWAFHADAVTEPVVQALVTTPILFLLCIAAAVVAARLRTPRATLLASLSLGLIAGYLVLGFFADAERVKFHWPMPGYLLALPFVPLLLRALWRIELDRAAPARVVARAVGRVLALFAPLTGITLVLAMAVLLVLGGQGTASLPRGFWLVDNTGGWHEVTAWARGKLSGSLRDVLIADNFMLAAELDFALGGREPIYVLEHPANVKHGRAAQLAAWRRDERALAAASWRRGLLLVEEASRRPVDRLAAYRALCERFGEVKLIDELRLRGGRAPFLAFEVTPRAAPGPCEVPAFAYVDTPAGDARIAGARLTVTGWAMREHVGVARVEVLIDGERYATADYGLPRPEVLEYWPQSEDPQHPEVGFSAVVPLRGLAAGPHRLALRVVDRRGRARVLAEQRFRYLPEA